MFDKSSSMSLLLAFSVVTNVSANVDWITPAKGDTFQAGDSFSARWMSPRKFVSPAFQLCSSPSPSSKRDDDASCGSTVRPDVIQESDMYSVLLSIPAEAPDGHYVLHMTDDIGVAHNSSPFSFSSPASVSSAEVVAFSQSEAANDKEDAATATQSSGDPNPDAQAPMTVPAIISSSLPAPDCESPHDTASLDTSCISLPSDADYLAPVPQKNSSSVMPSARPLPINHVPTANASASPLGTSLPSVTFPNVLATRIPPPVVAYAVPFSVFGAIILIAAVVGWRRQNRSLQEVRNQVASLSASEKDVESGFNLPYEVPVPLYAPRERSAPRDVFQYVGRGSMGRYTRWPARKSLSRYDSRYSFEEEDGGVTMLVVDDYLKPSPMVKMPATPKQVHMMQRGADGDSHGSGRKREVGNPYDVITDTIFYTPR